MVSDGAGIREDAVERHHDGDRREDRQEREERDAAARRQHPVLRDREGDPPGDVAPAQRRDIAGLPGLAAPPRLLGPRQIRLRDRRGILAVDPRAPILRGALAWGICEGVGHAGFLPLRGGRP